MEGPMAKVFISTRSIDHIPQNAADFAAVATLAKISEHLRSKFGDPNILNRSNIRLRKGQTWDALEPRARAAYIKGVLAQCGAAVVMIDSDWLNASVWRNGQYLDAPSSNVRV